LEKELDALQSSLASKKSADLLEQCEDWNGVKVLIRRVDIDDPKALREISDRFKDQIPSGVLLLGAVQGSKALLLAAVTADLIGRVHAGRLIKAVAERVGGGGGGRADMAQAGGSRPEHLAEALEAGRRHLEEKLAGGN